jgi:hypothetical protein
VSFSDQIVSKFRTKIEKDRSSMVMSMIITKFLQFSSMTEGMQKLIRVKTAAEWWK